MENIRKEHFVEMAQLTLRSIFNFTEFGQYISNLFICLFACF